MKKNIITSLSLLVLLPVCLGSCSLIKGLFHMSNITNESSNKEISVMWFSNDETYVVYECLNINIKEVVIPSTYNDGEHGLKPVTKIYKYAFKDCQDLTSVNIPNSVTSIGAMAFSGCSSLTSIDIPDSVTSIGDSAFSNCSSLKSFNINMIEEFEWLPFYVGENVESFEANSDNERYSSFDGVLFNKDRTSLIQYPVAKEGNLYSVPSTVDYINPQAFYSLSPMEHLREVLIPEDYSRRLVDSCFYRTDIGFKIYTYSRQIVPPSQSPNDKTVYYVYSDAEPTEDGNYWHFLNNKPTEW